MLLLRRRKLTDVVLSILFFLLLIVIFRLASSRVEVDDYVIDDDDADNDSAGGEGEVEQSDDKRKVHESEVQDLQLDDSNLDDVQRQIRKLLVLPSTEGLTSVGSVSAESGGGHRRKGRRGRKRGRRKRKGRRRGGGVGTAVGAGGRRGDFSQHGQSRFVDRKLNGLIGGFYIESGASDGETGSNSMFFEVERNWTGLLIEPNPKSFTKLLSKKRRAYSLNACLSPTGDTVSVRFKPAGGIGGIVDHMPEGHRQLVDRYGFDDVNVTCFTLYDIIRSLPISVSRVNYWSLDVEGAELPILERIDWSQLVPVDIISIEYKVKDAKGQTDQLATAEKLLALRKLFDKTKLYREIGKIHDVDIMFGRVDVVDSATSVEQAAGGGEKINSETQGAGAENAVQEQNPKESGENKDQVGQEKIEDDGQDGAGKDYGKDDYKNYGGQAGGTDKDDGVDEDNKDGDPNGGMDRKEGYDEDGNDKDGGQDGGAEKDDGIDEGNKDGDANDDENKDNDNDGN